MNRKSYNKKKYYKKKLPKTNIENSQKSKIPTRCIICFENIIYHTIFSDCSHTNTCYKCTLINRIKMLNNTCCFCKIESKDVIFSKDDSYSYGDVSIRTNNGSFDQNILQKINYDKIWNVYFTNMEILEKLKNLRKFFCRLCTGKPVVFISLHYLEEHLFTVHNKRFCELCLNSKKVFIDEQKLYDIDYDYEEHLLHGEDDEITGHVDGHPLCVFCQKRFYDDDELFRHMYRNSEHEQCYICKKNGIKFDFFKNYEHLKKHYGKEHFVCDNVKCIEKQFLAVFETKFELQCHVKREHEKSKKKIQLNMSDIHLSNPDQYSRGRDRTATLLEMGEIVDSSRINFIGEIGKARPLLYIQRKKEKEDDAIVKQLKKLKKTKKKSRFFLNKLRERKVLSYYNYQKFYKSALDFQNGKLKAFNFYTIFVECFGDFTNEYFNEYKDSIGDIKQVEALVVAKSTFESKEFTNFTEKKKENIQHKRGKKKIEVKKQNNTNVDNFPTIGESYNSHTRPKEAPVQTTSQFPSVSESFKIKKGVPIQSTSEFPFYIQQKKKNKKKNKKNTKKSDVNKIAQQNSSSGVAFCGGIKITYKKKKKKK